MNDAHAYYSNVLFRYYKALKKQIHPYFNVYVMAVYNLVLRSRVSSQEI